MGLFTSILGAVAGPIAGLFKKKEKPQVTENRVNYVQMVADAEAAGFNPLTVLRNGGSAGYGTQTQHPALSSSFGSRLGDVLATGVSAWAGFDPQAEQRAELEYNLVQEQLKSAQRSNRPTRSFGDVPTYTGTSSRASSGGFSTGVPVASMNPGGSVQSRTDPWTGSIFDPYMKIHPGLPDADTQSSRYGEIVEMIGGVGVLGGDLAYSGYKYANRKKGVDQALKEADDIAKYVKPKADAAASAWAKSMIPRKYYTPDMGTLRRGMVGTW